MTARKLNDFPSDLLMYGGLETSVLVVVYTLHVEGYKFQGTVNSRWSFVLLNRRRSISCLRLREPQV